MNCCGAGRRVIGYPLIRMAFPTTHWSLLALATLHGDSRATAALGEFYERYRRPVRAFFQFRGVEPDEVEDVVQAFFLQVMQRSLLRRADRERGMFRSYLCGAAVYFLSRWKDHREAIKRGGGTAALSIDDDGTPVPVTEAPSAVREAQHIRCMVAKKVSILSAII